MKSYCLYNDRIEFAINPRRTFTIYFNENSGKIYFRYNRGQKSAIKHPGIFLGVDGNGSGYFLHNHFEYGQAHISNELEFRKNMQLFPYKEKFTTTPLQAIEHGLNALLHGSTYDPVANNKEQAGKSEIYYEESRGNSEIWLILVLVATLIIYTFN